MTSRDAIAALYAELEATGDWYGHFPADDPRGAGRVTVQRVMCGDYVQDAEVFRTFDGRGWVIDASSQCPTCIREVRIIERLTGTEVDLASAVNEIALRLGEPPYEAYQHVPGCPRAAEEAEAEGDALNGA
ncbi:hypothetical protein P5P86_19575 [Nocardioides sp. BP30]|uniref:hypothetical protein n=1 Tax=Nocardioides sp. BP30 TaxID=3036374 RepID=UPI002469143F|nr:hypothetical protein [Nocardioides sp. BP30]WGL52139.1 hypothetical protein P5P86_19575 [Nocardioides sp. BP30]